MFGMKHYEWQQHYSLSTHTRLLVVAHPSYYIELKALKLKKTGEEVVTEHAALIDAELEAEEEDLEDLAEEIAGASEGLLQGVKEGVKAVAAKAPGGAKAPWAP